MRLRSGSNGARGVAGFAAGFARIARLSALVMLSLLALGATALSFAPVAHADSVSLAILVPKPSSNTAEGPVGTNDAQWTGHDGRHDYQLSYALTVQVSNRWTTQDGHSRRQWRLTTVSGRTRLVWRPASSATKMRQDRLAQA
jgi:hypothetical protein